MQMGFVIALIRALMPKTVEQMSAAGGAGDAGKVLAVGPDGKVKTETLTSGSVVIDSELSTASTNAVQNKAVAEHIALSTAQIDALTDLLE